MFWKISNLYFVKWRRQFTLIYLRLESHPTDEDLRYMQNMSKKEKSFHYIASQVPRESHDWHIHLLSILKQMQGHTGGGKEASSKFPFSEDKLSSSLGYPALEFITSIFTVQLHCTDVSISLIGCPSNLSLIYLIDRLCRSQYAFISLLRGACRFILSWITDPS